MMSPKWLTNPRISQITVEQARKVVLFGLFFALTMLVIAIFLAVPGFISHTHSIGYDAPEYIPYETELCPGDMLIFDRVITNQEPGEIVLKWYWVNAENSANVLSAHRSLPALVVPTTNSKDGFSYTTVRQTPRSAMMVPGSKWLHIQIAEHENGDEARFMVPFTIADDCQDTDS